MHKDPAASDTLSKTSDAMSAAAREGDRAASVFLTPRVLDQSAFDALAGELKGLIQDADGQGRNLRKTTDDVKGLTGALRTALTELQNRLERAGKVSPALEQWIVEARELTASSIDSKRVAKELERAIAGIVEGRKAEFEHSVAPTVETLRQLRREMDRIKTGVDAALDEQAVTRRVEDAMARAIAGFEKEIAAKVERSLGRAMEAYQAKVVLLETRAMMACQMLANSTGASERAADAAQRAVDKLNDRHAELERASAARFAAAEDRLAAGERRAAGIQHRTNSVLAQAEEAGRRAELRASEIERQLDTATSRAVVLECETITALGEGLGEVERRAGKLAELPDLLSRGERMMSDARDSVAQAEAFKGQAEEARRMLADDLMSGAEAIDDLAAKAAAVEAFGNRQKQEELCAAIQAAIESSQRVEEITRLRLAELREVENLLGSLGGRVASLRANAMQIHDVKPRNTRESDRDAA